MPFQTDGMAVRNVRIKSFYFTLVIYCPVIANQIKPGQLIMLKVSDSTAPLLRRPFNIYKSHPVSHSNKSKRGHLFLLYKMLGKGTRRFTTLLKGEKVDLIGPLGNGFSLSPLPSPLLLMVF